MEKPCEVCKKPTTKRCACRNVAYCSIECQKKHYGEHWMLCPFARQIWWEERLAAPTTTTPSEGVGCSSGGGNSVMGTYQYIEELPHVFVDSPLIAVGCKKGEESADAAGCKKGEEERESIGALKEEQIERKPIGETLQQLILNTLLKMSKETKETTIDEERVKDLWKNTKIFFSNYQRAGFKSLTEFFKTWVDVRPNSLILVTDVKEEESKIKTETEVKRVLNNALKELLKPGFLLKCLNKAKEEGDDYKRYFD